MTCNSQQIASQIEGYNNLIEKSKNKKIKRLQKHKEVIERNKQLNLDEIKCAVCLSEPETNKYGILQCNHKFCIDCILDWSKVTNLCPLCKREFLEIKKLDTIKNTEQKIPVQPKKQVNHEEMTEEELQQYQEEQYGHLEENCYVCKSAENGDDMLICDGCDLKVCHVTCDDEIYDGQVPEGNWYCHTCRGSSRYLDDDVSEQDEAADLFTLTQYNTQFNNTITITRQRQNNNTTNNNNLIQNQFNNQRITRQITRSNSSSSIDLQPTQVQSRQRQQQNRNNLIQIEDDEQESSDIENFSDSNSQIIQVSRNNQRNNLRNNNQRNQMQQEDSDNEDNSNNTNDIQQNINSRQRLQQIYKRQRNKRNNRNTPFSISQQQEQKRNLRQRNNEINYNTDSEQENDDDKDLEDF